MEKVTAVITTHNRCDLLRKALDSVLGQTYNNIECIIVDDASTDDTKLYLESIKCEKIKCIIIDKKDSKGGNYARNLGIAHATGDFIAFLDDDDEWFPEKIEKQIQYIKSSKGEIGFVYCGHVNELNGEYRWESYANAEYSGDLSQKVFQNIFCTTSKILVRKDLLEDIGGFDENLRFWQEYDLCIRLCQITKIGCITQPLILLRHNTADRNRLSNKYKEWKQTVEVINDKYFKLISDLPENIKKERELMILRDAAIRCESCKNKKEQRICLYQIWEITKKINHLIRYLFNIGYIESQVKYSKVIPKIFK